MDVCVLHDAAGKARAGDGLAGMPAQTVNKLYVPVHARDEIFISLQPKRSRSIERIAKPDRLDTWR